MSRSVPGLPSSPARPPTPPPRPTESVTARLHRLRLENYRHGLNLRHSSPTPSTSSSAQGLAEGWKRSVEVPEGAGVGVGMGERRVVGPGIPKSWKPLFDHPKPDLPPLSSSSSSCSSPISPILLSRRRVLRLPDQGVINSTLVDECLKRLVRDLRGDMGSLDVVGEIEERFKERLMELASEWGPLSDRAAVGLLVPLEPTPPSPSSSDEDGEEEWDAASPLSTLPLSFSTLTLPTLKSILFTPSPGPTPTPSLRFPHLVALHLSSCPSIPPSQNLLSILSRLPLKHLSLAASPLHPNSALRSEVVMNKLATATPGLVTLDVSFNPSWAGVSHLELVDWVVKWGRLEVLCVVGNVEDPARDPGSSDVSPDVDRGEKAVREKKLKLVREVWEARRQAGGVWIDVEL